MKMLKEEKELRKFYSVAYPSEAAEIKRDFKKMLSALVRAVREDSIRIMRQNCTSEEGETCGECDKQAAAIRGGK